MTGIFGTKPILGTLILASIACTPSIAVDNSVPVTPLSGLVASPCKSAGGLADRRCTPGAVSTAVTQDNIQTTICVKGYTATVRPPMSFTENLKRKQMKLYGYGPKVKLSQVEEDHLVPLEVGGNPTDPNNLWPEPRKGKNGAAVKDQDENVMRRSVCSGKMTLADAQKHFMEKWTQ